MIKQDKIIKLIYIEDIKYDKMIEHEHNRLTKLMFSYMLFSKINKLFKLN